LAPSLNNLSRGKKLSLTEAPEGGGGNLRDKEKKKKKGRGGLETNSSSAPSNGNPPFEEGGPPQKKEMSRKRRTREIPRKVGRKKEKFAGRPFFGKKLSHQFLSRRGGRKKTQGGGKTSKKRGRERSYTPKERVGHGRTLLSATHRSVTTTQNGGGRITGRGEATKARAKQGNHRNESLERPDCIALRRGRVN